MSAPPQPPQPTQQASASAPPPIAPTAFDPMTKQEVVNALDQIPTFNIVTSADNRIMGVPDEAGEECVRWYVDPDEASSALLLAQTLKPAVPLQLAVTPLGTAFALSEGWQKTPSTLPLRLHAKRAVLGASADAAFPLFACDELSNSRVMPLFLSKEDLRDTWVAAGRPAEAVPAELAVTQLRSVARLMLTDTHTNWRTAMFVASAKGIEKAQQLQEQQQAARRPPAEPEDEPPPLQ